MKDDILLLAETLANRCLEIYKLLLLSFLNSLGLSWHIPFKNTKIKFDVFIDVGMLLMIEKHISEVVYHAIMLLCYYDM